jgi:hypothetical protein
MTLLSPAWRAGPDHLRTLQKLGRLLRTTPLPDCTTSLSRMGIGLLPPRDDEIEKVIEKDDQRSARQVIGTPNGGVTLARI